MLLGTRWRHARQHPSRQLRERSTTAASHPHFDEARLKPRAAAPPAPLAARAAGGRAALGQRRRRRTSSGGTAKAALRPSGQSADPPALSRPPAALATVMSVGRRHSNGAAARVTPAASRPAGSTRANGRSARGAAGGAWGCCGEHGKVLP